MLKKNEEYVVQIIDNGFGGEGIAKIDNFIVFVPNTLKDEKVKIKILKVTSSHAFAKVVDIIEKSNNRIENDCDTYSKCGGCALRHIKYDESVLIKKKTVENTLKKTLGKKVKIDEVIKMEYPFFYRNKLQYPIGLNEENEPVMGVYAERSHRIIETCDCKIQNKLCQDIANSIFEYIKENKIEVYNEKNLKGSIRHLVIRVGIKTNEVLVMLVTNTEKIEKEKEFVDYITKKYKEIKTIVKNVNNKNTNVILGNKTQVIFGNGYIEDYIGKFKFKISPMSFYQVNPIQTKKLYDKAIEYASLVGTETVLDLYCGIGTIGICASEKVKKLYGIETIPEAIEDAKENAKMNNVKNAEFFVGDVENKLPKFIKEKDVNSDVVFIDPPRKGCDKTAVDTLIKISPQRIVYVSCNPATLARDLKLFEEKYEIKKIAICDMFPFTSHVECVSVLNLKKISSYL